MGQNLALNIADHGFKISVYNRTKSKMEDFVASNPNTPGGLEGCETLESFVASLKRPRKIIILVQAGWATDKVIEGLVPLIEEGDIIIDGGNSRWDDTIRREKNLSAKGLRFIGSGVSGGEEGARFGPSLMPGGDPEAWSHLEPIWKAIAAKVDPETGKPLAAIIARQQSATNCGSAMRHAPKRPDCTRSEGHPTFKLISQKPRPAARSTAFASLSGWLPPSCNTSGCSTTSWPRSRSRFPWITASAVTISEKSSASGTRCR